VNYLNKSSIAEATEVGTITGYSNGRIYSTLHDNTALSHKIFTDGGLITSQAAVRQTASGAAWKLSPTSTNRCAYYPLILSIAKIAVDSGNAVTVSAWCLRDSVDIVGKMVCRKEQLSGMSTDLTATISAGINEWEQLSLSFTPTENGVVEIEAWAYGGMTNSIYVDSITVS
jgi:hypothetical protein